ncbi:uncharacterized protein LOC143469597 isoform X2 [Clavelina lepadiformis]|uniref:uncharacterized protein LOC143469597 isoform X2 n=1 Tax=Clavelina lepadiformis TaxID=159417 RepID=UPI004042A15E
MNITKGWKFPPMRQTISNVFWRKPVHQDVALTELSIKPGQKVHFEKVEYMVDAFVEDIVPQCIEEVYKLHEEIRTLKEANSCKKQITERCDHAIKVVHGLQQKVVEMDNLRDHIYDEDLDDFDLRIQPTKTKINNAIIHFLGTTPSRLLLPETPESPRSLKARDLLSFLSDEEHASNSNQNGNCSDQCTSEEKFQEITLKELKQVDFDKYEEAETSLDKLNRDLVDLHALINNLHKVVQEQGEVVDGIAENIESAEENIAEGTKSLKKSAIIKAAMFPVVGAVVGGVVGGPLGFAVGLKLGSVTSCIGVAGVTGTVLGYQGGKVLKKQQNKTEESKKQDGAIQNES